MENEKTVFVVICSFLVLILGLFIVDNVIIIDKSVNIAEILKKDASVELSQRQIEVAGFIFTKDKKNSLCKVSNDF